MQSLNQFLYSCLVTGNVDFAFEVVADDVLGVGLGEQGIVKNYDEAFKLMSAQKVNEHAAYDIKYTSEEIRYYPPGFAAACVSFILLCTLDGKTTETGIVETAALRKIDGKWKICLLQGAFTDISKDTIEAFPIEFAERTLAELKSELSLDLNMDLYRKAMLAEAMAFYNIDITNDIFEDCTVNDPLCIVIEPGQPYSGSLENILNGRLNREDMNEYIKVFSRNNILETYRRGNNEVRLEYLTHSGNDRDRWMRTTMRLVIEKSTGKLKGFMHVKDIDYKKRTQLEIEYKSKHDLMTNVLNKASLIKSIEDALKEEDVAEKGAFIILDVDEFKHINDTYGHPFGDEVLIKVADILKSNLKKTDIIGRIGGDEFCVFLPKINSHKRIVQYIENIRTAISNIYICDDGSYGVSCSMGVALCNGRKMTFDEIYKEADMAMYQIKKNGKNGYCIYNYDK